QAERLLLARGARGCRDAHDVRRADACDRCLAARAVFDSGHHEFGAASEISARAANANARHGDGPGDSVTSVHVPVTAVVGAQWGDEGKGKITDLLAQDADFCIRYQGGNNAGHTVVNDSDTFKLHLVPSGIFNSSCMNIVGTGTVVD